MRLLDMEKLSKGRINIDAAWFKKTFGNVPPGHEHLWRQFSMTYRSDIPAFWRYLGNGEKMSLKKLFLDGLNSIEVSL